MNNEILIIDHFFNQEELYKALQLLPYRTRKKRFEDRNFEESFSDICTRILTEYSFLEINTAIRKRYIRGESSGAYIYHVDPPEYRSKPLVLITLKGSATLKAKIKDTDTTIECKENRAMILINPDIPHVVGEPTNVSGIREFLFLGYKSI